MNRVRVGIAVHGSQLVGVREFRGFLEEPINERCEADEPLGAAIERLLNALVGSSTGTQVAVLFLDDRCASGPLFGVDANEEESAVRRWLEEEPTGFFLGSTGSLRGGNVWLYEGSWYGTVVHVQSATEIQRTIARARGQLIGIGMCAPETDLTSAAGLATEMRSDAPGVVDVEREARAQSRARLQRGVIVASVSAVLFAALVIPQVLLRRDLSREQARLTLLRTERDAAAAALQHSPVTPELLARIKELELERVVVRGTLFALAEALPDSTAITALRLDEREGQATILSSDAAGSLGQIARQSALSGFRMVGAIATENGPTARLERIDVRWNRP